ncbi:MAG: cytochrome P450, partial [Phormidesmis sp.]
MEVFKPERWLETDGQLLEKQLPRGVYFPFGDGPRICIGKGFAMAIGTGVVIVGSAAISAGVVSAPFV